MKISALTNGQLLNLCQKYGAQARLWRLKFIGLLPEVNKRRLFEEKGCSSIFEFAAKFCGLSADQTRLALNLEKRIEDKPVLKQMFTNGEASMYKLNRVASIATAENEEELAAKIKLLPKSALETFVRDEKRNAGSRNTNELENMNGLQKPLIEGELVPGHELRFKIADDVKQELNELCEKGMDVNDLLRKMLQKRREEIAQEKEELSAQAQSTESRYIPVQVREVLKKEFGDKCSIRGCSKPSAQIHHTQRFSMGHLHDPKFLAPLCKDHHSIAHSIDQKYFLAKETAKV